MVTVDLTRRSATTDAPDGHLLAQLPRRLTLTLPELRLAAELAGAAPLPFTTRAPRPGHPPGLGVTMTDPTPESREYAAAFAALRDPRATLRHRGLVTRVDSRPALDPGVAGAIGLLATGQLALDLDVNVEGRRVRSWQRQSGPAVAALATTDGLVFELSWFGVDHWPGELTRSALLPAEVTLGPSEVPVDLCTPYPLLAAVGEALRIRRADLVGVLVAQAGGAVRVGETALEQAEAGAALMAVHTETKGRLRVLAGRIEGEAGTGSPAVGVVSWLLLADGWRAVVAKHDHPEASIMLSSAAPEDLPATLAPVVEAVNA